MVLNVVYKMAAAIFSGFKMFGLCVGSIVMRYDVHVQYVSSIKHESQVFAIDFSRCELLLCYKTLGNYLEIQPPIIT